MQIERMLPDSASVALKFDETILSNGLTLRLLAMPDYGAVHAIYAARFGSVHRVFKHEGDQIYLPAGTAHFLEHKMFENEDGVNAFAMFSETGALANAYTSFDRTSYVFTATSEIDKNLDILLSFVGHPHFTDATVQKEQGIIGQEIGMYDDDQSWRCLVGVLSCMYHNHPVREHIAGTVASIAEITPQLLYKCARSFYSPANMVLCAAGNITMRQLEDAVSRTGLSAAKLSAPPCIFPNEPLCVALQKNTIEMAAGMPMFALGFKEAPILGDTTKTEVACNMLRELLCGRSSELYRRLYDEGVLQSDFSGEFNCFEGAAFFLFSGKSRQPERVRDEMYKEINRFRAEGIDPEQFEICKRMMYGEAISNLESVGQAASLLRDTLFRGSNPAAGLHALVGTTLSDAQAALDTMLMAERSSMFRVLLTE